MYPMIACGNCGGGIQFIPELAGAAVMCPHCGVNVEMPGGRQPATPEPPVYHQTFEEPYVEPAATPSKFKLRRRKTAARWPGVVVGAGLAMMLYTAFIRNSEWLVIELAYEGETIPAALWRQFNAGVDVAGQGGLIAGILMIAFGGACFLVGQKAK